MTVGFGQFVLELFQNVSLFALVAAGYAALKRFAHRLPLPVDFATGIVFGLGALLAMVFHITAGPGIYLDGRNIMAVLSALFGGPVAAAATLAITVAYRLWLGGAGAPAGVAAAILAALVGLGFRRRLRRHAAKPDSSQLMAMGILVVLASAIAVAVFIPGSTGRSILDISLPQLIVVPLGTWLLGIAMQNEDDRQALLQTLDRGERRLKDAIDSIPEGFVLLDSGMRVVTFNQRFLELYPKTAPAVAVGTPFDVILRHGARNGEYPGVQSDTEVDDFVRRWMARFSADQPYFGEGAFASGRWVLVSHRRTAGGDFVSVRTDITQQKQRERELADLLGELIASEAAAERAHVEAKRASDLLLSITDALPALVAHADREQRYTHCNKEYMDLFGLDPKALVGKRMEEVIQPEVYAVLKPRIEATLAGQEQAFVRPMITREGTRYAEQRYIPEFNAAGEVVGFYSIAWDITERYRREQELDKEALTDALTGLLNRRAMLRAIEEAAAGWQTGGAHGAVLFLDVDHFKQINDTMGHDAGDELLKVFAERIRSVVRTSDKVARFGGDEFVILITAPDAEEVAKRVAATLLDRVRKPIRLADQEISISTSIGVALAFVPAASPAMLLKEADLALYEAKAAGRDRYALRRLAEG